MTSLDNLGEVITTDLLIIGGGIAGLIAAICAKESSADADVLLLDKQSIGWGGKANKGACILYTLPPHQDIDAFVAYHTKNESFYLNDQELMRTMAAQSYGMMDKLDQWGVTVIKNDAGKADYADLPFGWSLSAIEADLMLKLRKTAKKMGTKTLNKIQIVDLLKEKDRVIGAVGFGLLDAKFYIINAKATILANGDCQYKIMRMWDGCGDGVAAAYRAGAEMRNAEFGNFCDILSKDSNGALPHAHLFLYNAKGEFITPKYMPETTPDIPFTIIDGMEKEVLAGNGPIYLDMPSMMQHMAKVEGMWERPKVATFFGRQVQKLMKYGAPPSQRIEVVPGFIGELAPVKVDHQMQTTVAGLYAIGDTSRSGSAWTGAIPPPAAMRGSGLMNAALTAAMAAPAAIKYLSQVELGNVDAAQVETHKKEILTPLQTDTGYKAEDALWAVREVIVPSKCNMRRSKDRMQQALAVIKEVQSKLGDLSAKDSHELHKCHEAKAIAICAEMGYKAALARTESRGWHQREDFPARDDKNWLKWIILKQDGDEMALSTEPVPIERFKNKPE